MTLWLVIECQVELATTNITFFPKFQEILVGRDCHEALGLCGCCHLYCGHIACCTSGTVCKPASCSPTRTRRVPDSCFCVVPTPCVVSQQKGGSPSLCLPTSGYLTSNVRTLVMTQYRTYRAETCLLPYQLSRTQRAAQDVSSFRSHLSP